MSTKKMLKRISVVGLLSIFFLINCKPKNESKESEALSPSLAQLVDSLQLQKEDLNIFIDKTAYTLAVRSQTKVIRSYPVVFGGNPVDDKLMEGDGATPEGKFQIRAFYPHKSWSKFIWIDYPTEDSWKKHQQAKAEQRIPEGASIGGEIGIHGVPEGSSNLITSKKNWTLGCISMTNAAVDDLYGLVYTNMKIEIVR